jgi:hypothetical protein
MGLLYISDDDERCYRPPGYLLLASKLQTAPWQREDPNARAQTCGLGRHVLDGGRTSPLPFGYFLGYVERELIFRAGAKRYAGGLPLPWSSPRILGLTVSGGITLIIFGFWEAYSGTPNPLVPMHFFKDVRGFTMLFIISCVSGTVYVATAIIWPSQVA